MTARPLTVAQVAALAELTTNTARARGLRAAPASSPGYVSSRTAASLIALGYVERRHPARGYPTRYFITAAGAAAYYEVPLERRLIADELLEERRRELAARVEAEVTP